MNIRRIFSVHALCLVLLVFVGCVSEDDDSVDAIDIITEDVGSAMDAGQTSDMGIEIDAGVDTGNDANHAPDAGDAAVEMCDYIHAPIPGEFNQYECDPFCQDCPLGGACVIGQNSAVGRVTSCAPSGTATQSDLCNPFSDLNCAPGFSCISARLTACSQICGTGPDAPGCPEQSECVVDEGESVGNCFPTSCSLFSNRGCSAETACYAVDGVNRCLPFNSEANLRDSCETLQDCNRDQFCVPLRNGGGECRTICTRDSDCALGTCLFFQIEDENYYPVGGCVF
jgi:hypothetical protein